MTLKEPGVKNAISLPFEKKKTKTKSCLALVVRSLGAVEFAEGGGGVRGIQRTAE